MSENGYDVAIIGAGPAGAAAANLLARRDVRVVLVDRATFPRPVACAGWLSAGAVPLLKELGAPAKLLVRRAFRKVTFYTGDFTQRAKPAFKEAPGYLIDRARFDHELVRAAVQEGVTLVEGCAAVGFRLMESAVVAELADGRTLQAKLLLLATGRGPDMLERVGIAVGTVGTPTWIAQVDALLSGRAATREPHVTVVLGLDQGGSFGLCCASPERTTVSVHWVGDRTDVIPMLVHVCGQAFSHQVVPVDLSAEARSAKEIASGPAAALDMDTHVGKHTLVIGEAGGFVSAASHEGIYPALWSARIAVDVVEKALHSVHSQDELMTFDSAWRMQMADYLRAPHTDIQFLLPLIFTNQPMADRMGAAFFHGENI